MEICKQDVVFLGRCYDKLLAGSRNLLTVTAPLSGLHDSTAYVMLLIDAADEMCCK